MRVPGRARGRRPAQSMRSGDGLRCRGGRSCQVRASGAPPPRDWPGEARPRSRSGRRGVERCFWRVDRVRPGAPMASRYVTVLEAGTRGRAAVFSPESTPWCCLAAFWGRVGAAASPAASATHTKWPLSAGAWFAHVGARIGTSSVLFSRKFKTAHARQLCQGCPPCQYASHLWCEASEGSFRSEERNRGPHVGWLVLWDFSGRLCFQNRLLALQLVAAGCAAAPGMPSAVFGHVITRNYHTRKSLSCVCACEVGALTFLFQVSTFEKL